MSSQRKCSRPVQLTRLEQRTRSWSSVSASEKASFPTLDNLQMGQLRPVKAPRLELDLPPAKCIDYPVGQIAVDFSPPLQLLAIGCSISASIDPEDGVTLYFVQDGEPIHTGTPVLPRQILKNVAFLLRKHMICFALASARTSMNGAALVNIGLLPAAFTDISDWCSETEKNHFNHLCSLLRFFGTPSGGHSGSSIDNSFRPEQFFEMVQPKLEETSMIDQPLKLLPSLRSYQRRAVSWMVSKEQPYSYFDPTPQYPHPLWRSFQCLNGTSFFYNPFLGCVTLQQPPRFEETLRGGVLADEMGLGKTVEVLALILSNPAPQAMEVEGTCCSNLSSKGATVDSDDEYLVNIDDVSSSDEEYTLGKRKRERLASPSYGSSEMISSGATLIISPSSISVQWEQEISKHIASGSLKVVTYLGAKVHRIPAKELSQFDIVITTYEVLRNELYHIPMDARPLRYEKKYKVHPTPLTNILWWRICLDEAQLIESTTAKAAEMANHLSSLNRWCVTGTPVQRSIDDLYGLLVFLNVTPYTTRKWWQRCLEDPYMKQSDMNALVDLFKALMWRVSKSRVSGELMLPPQHEQTTVLLFSPVEQYYYRQQHEQCYNLVYDCVGDQGSLGGSLDALDVDDIAPQRSTLLSNHPSAAKLFGSTLLRLRQACCHPQVGGSNRDDHRSRAPALQQNAMSMDELLTYMLDVARVDKEEAQRRILMFRNGLAGLEWVKGNFVEAAAQYRTALHLVDSDTRTDAMQRLHILHNLALLLNSHGDLVGRTLRDDQLNADADTIRMKYLSDARNIAADCQIQYQETADSISHTTNQLELLQAENPHARTWWECVVSVADSKTVDVIFTRLRERLNVTVLKFRDISGLQYCLWNDIENISTARNAWISSLWMLIATPSTAEDVQQLSTCRACQQDVDGPLCRYCHAHELLCAYEKKLFAPSEQLDKESVQGVWKDSDMSVILQTLAMSVRILSDQSMVDQSKLHLDLLELLKKEFKRSSQLWQALKTETSKMDELQMAVTRIQLLAPGEPAVQATRSYKIYRHEVDPMEKQMLDDLKLAESLFHHSASQFNYLSELQRSTRKGGEAKICPVCQEAIGGVVVLFLCGHAFCFDCIQAMVNYASKHRAQTLKCPTCRTRINISDISYISDGTPSIAVEHPPAELRPPTGLNGSWGTKFDHIVRLILQLDTTEKVLIFSQWQDVLELLLQALTSNSISCIRVKGSSKSFQTQIDKFKTTSAQVLLLPFQRGANGLNLIEATHIVLVEPLLNSGLELQALNRVHRIGQTKETHIHRFVIKSSIEERIAHLSAKLKMTSARSLKSTEQESLSVQELAWLLE